MSQIPDADHLAHMARLMLAGTVVPFLGAGANLCGRPDQQSWVPGVYLPSGAELAAELIELVTYPDSGDRDLMRISQYVEAAMTTEQLYAAVRTPFADKYTPTALHVFLARMSRLLGKRGKPRQVILTTNYDDSLECAFDAIPEPYDLIWYEAKGPDCGRFIHHPCAADDPTPILHPNEYADLEPDERTVIVKLHGAMIREDPSRDSYVITEDDYIRYLTGADVAGQLPVVLRERIKESNLLFLGYSMRDWNLRVLLDRLGGEEVRTNKVWSVQREPNTPAQKQIEETLWRERNIDLRFILLDKYIAALNVKIKEALDAEEAKRLAQERARELARESAQAAAEPELW